MESDRSYWCANMERYSLMRLLKGFALCAVFWLASTMAQASNIAYRFNFSDSNIITGSFAFDDTSGQPLNGIPTLTAFLLTDLYIKFEDLVNFPQFGTQTWDESGWNSNDVPPVGGVILDQSGNVALSGSVTNTLGNTIVFDFNGSGNPYVITSATATDPLGASRTYQASRISTPGGAALLMLGIFCLALNRQQAEIWRS